MERQLAALLCRTSDRAGDAATGTRELAELLGARIIGTPGTPQALAFEDDLRRSRGCLLEAGGQVDDALDAGRMPILLAGECSICVATLPVVARHRPAARVLWLDAHADFNTPVTTASRHLAGMCLAGACGLWDTGFGAGLDPARVIMFGVRDVEGGERVALDRAGVYRLEQPAQLEGMELFVHIDLDVLDPEAHPASFPAPGGLAPEALLELLAYVDGAATIVGAEITSAAPGYARVAATAIAPLLA
ncbi:MAG: arginase family protein [Solirubrobacteraceae bacterium]|nr:arginase family protein [Solirubrobacteraceae bacterium]